MYIFVSFRIRKVIHTIVASPYFDNTILVLILISSMLLAFEDATDPDAKVNNVSYGTKISLYLYLYMCERV